ncbi:hypothetical protein EJB05_52264, partial [Eragrostis curvula]
MAPEWVSGLPITEKVHVYCYGVVLFELVKGVRISDWVVDGVLFADMDTRIVVKVIQEKMDADDQQTCFTDLIDWRLKGTFNELPTHSWMLYIHLPTHRPSPQRDLVEGEVRGGGGRAWFYGGRVQRQCKGGRYSGGGKVGDGLLVVLEVGSGGICGYGSPTWWKRPAHGHGGGADG